MGEYTPILKKEYIIEVIKALNENSEQYFDLCELISSIPQEKDYKNIMNISLIKGL